MHVDVVEQRGVARERDLCDVVEHHADAVDRRGHRVRVAYVTSHELHR